MEQSFIKFLLEHGVLVTIALFTFYITFRYLNMKLEMMQKEFNNKLSEKSYKIEGSVNHKILASSNKFEVDLKISEEIEKNNSN